MNFFSWNQYNSTLEINQPELMLVKEFRELANRSKKSKDVDRLYRELSYLFLKIDWKSPYSDYNDDDRDEAAVSDSGISDKELNDKLFLDAYDKYEELQNQNISIKAITKAKALVNRLIDNYDNIDPNERKDDRTLIFKGKDIMAEIDGLPGLLENIDRLEEIIRKNMSADSDIRGGYEEGFVD